MRLKIIRGVYLLINELVSYKIVEVIVDKELFGELSSQQISLKALNEFFSFISD